MAKNKVLEFVNVLKNRRKRRNESLKKTNVNHRNSNISDQTEHQYGGGRKSAAASNAVIYIPKRCKFKGYMRSA